jgi:hypothetical protein
MWQGPNGDRPLTPPFAGSGQPRDHIPVRAQNLFQALRSASLTALGGQAKAALIGSTFLVRNLPLHPAKRSWKQVGATLVRSVHLSTADSHGTG